MKNSALFVYTLHAVLSNISNQLRQWLLCDGLTAIGAFTVKYNGKGDEEGCVEGDSDELSLNWFCLARLWPFQTQCVWRRRVLHAKKE